MGLRRISNEDVHNLTSGQVITDLSNVVKELLENAIDAHSTFVSITFRKYGLEGIEITDDGDGIDETDFANLCLKNYTSKLENFEQLVGVKTLGFRGEALNSICNVSSVQISTATQKNSPKGYCLKFDRSGNILGKKLVNQKKGTTIQITDIFKNLPVRRINLEKNSRKEFQKCLLMLNAYLLISTDSRIIVYNIDSTGRKKIVAKTSGNKLLEDNIVNVFGSGGLQGLHKFADTLNLADKFKVKINGLLSGSSIGEGRLTKDRQYIFINKRPVDFKRVLKLANETYKKFNYVQVPVIILNLEIDGDLIDVNVTPDKRTILLSNKYEALLMDELESSLEVFWDHQGTYTLPVDDSYQEKILERNTSLKQQTLESFALTQEEVSPENVEDSNVSIELVERASMLGSNSVASITASESGNDITSGIIESLSDTQEIPDEAFEVSIASTDNDNVPSINCDEADELELVDSQLAKSIEYSVSMNEFEQIHREASGSCSCSCSHSEDEVDVHDDKGVSEPLFIDENDDGDFEVKTGEENSGYLPPVDSVPISPSGDHKATYDKMNEKKRVSDDISLYHQTIRINENDLSFPKKRICVAAKGQRTAKTVKECDISNREESEKMLGLSIHKQDFIDMHIVGQFNKGFIIVHKKDTDDILIVDQHASDEKFNFEKLIEETVFENQPLVVPQRLDVSPIERLVISSNLGLFEKNGFRFKYANSSPIKEEIEEDEHEEKLLLTSLPYSKNTIFDLKDLNELIQLVQDNASSLSKIPRPSKVRSMFAMRACRSSIMIGDSLSKPRMRKVVQNLSTLDKPWNCPHGRPTMRHLVKIDTWKPFEDDYGI